MGLNNRKSRKNHKNKSRKNKSRTSARGGGLGIGRAISRALGLKLTPLQKWKDLNDKLFKFFMWNYRNTLMHPDESETLVASMLNGFFGVINIQTENDVIALEVMRLRTASGERITEEEKKSNLEEWEAAGKPDPTVGDIIYNADKILDAGQKDGRFAVSDYQVSENEFMKRLKNRFQE